MSRLYIFVEGQTEQTFASEILNSHLANLGVYLYPILIANGRKAVKRHVEGEEIITQ